MTRRTIHTLKGQTHAARVQYSPDLKEYRVTVFRADESHADEATAYYTDNKGDAYATAHAMLASQEAEAARQRAEHFQSRQSLPIW